MKTLNTIIRISSIVLLLQTSFIAGNAQNEALVIDSRPTYEVHLKKGKHILPVKQPYKVRHKPVHHQNVKVVYRQLPPQAKPIALNGISYYHHHKVFYKPHHRGGYIIVRPPEFLPRVPQEAIRVYHKGQYKLYYDGIYLKYTPYGYVIL